MIFKQFAIYFKLKASQEDYLLKQPETGMGYQIVEASKSGSYSREKFLKETNGWIKSGHIYECNPKTF